MVLLLCSSLASSLLVCCFYIVYTYIVEPKKWVRGREKSPCALNMFAIMFGIQLTRFLDFQGTL